MILFRRSELKVRYNMEHNGTAIGLGHFRDLNTHVRYHELPNDISLAWIGLEPGEHFSALAHPVDSFLIVQKGKALFQGAQSSEMSNGDLVQIPQNYWHEYAMGDDEGFEALSLTFEGQPLFSPERPPFLEQSSIPKKAENFVFVRRSEKCFRDYDRLLPSGYRARWIYVKEGKTEKIEFQGPTYIINFDGRCKIAGEHQDIEMLSQDIMYFDIADTLQFSTLRKSTLLSLERINPEVELEGLS
ncbi:MAG: hypothetical protein COW00_11165 [Bdellovibrio sp. CG12_big_fil_rev_8_21_14_0_65_39_13]|nr:MAG: hypothetical protein COW78_16520 [Bdellovibrio sp. CG22_combo_CG10-13_8_21_14_all_39_27]PIQ59280.1 MAG: hypothetical protein COW00_11165 [Bdellovibrio sp. CG12_big_fil_rev_8_21_14_0_65_39_13]PIR32291.1 MAG: hypothetical protein COV37_20455 [Bdellovibrio sp. CG11_big_fil_rev_8_21_14_0_20_39_38]